MELLLHSIQLDWPVLLPILVCSILTVMVVIDRALYYRDNKRNVAELIPRLKRPLINNDIQGVKNIALQCGGIYGEVIEEAARIFTEQRRSFARSFDISLALATRCLEHRLTILGTIGGVAPFLGLFGTVVRILYTFQDLASQGNQSAAVAMGIGSALIATAFGLGVAIIAVVFYNMFQSTIRRFEDDFQMLKLFFLNHVDLDEEPNTEAKSGIALG